MVLILTLVVLEGLALPAASTQDNIGINSVLSTDVSPAILADRGR